MNVLRIVSADDHVIEPPELWQNHVRRRLRDLAPKVLRIAVSPDDPRVPVKMRDHVVEAEDGTDFWSYDDNLVPLGDSTPPRAWHGEDYTLDPRPLRSDPAGLPRPDRPRRRYGSRRLAASWLSVVHGLRRSRLHRGQDKSVAIACVAGYTTDARRLVRAAPTRLIPLPNPPMERRGAVKRCTVSPQGCPRHRLLGKPFKLGLPSNMT